MTLRELIKACSDYDRETLVNIVAAGELLHIGKVELSDEGDTICLVAAENSDQPTYRDTTKE
jgi:hypothetical protein